MSILSDLFPISLLYNFSNLTYPGGLWSFTFASKGLHPINDFNEKRIKESLKFEYYNNEIHKAAFSLPTFMKNNLEPYLKG